MVKAARKSAAAAGKAKPAAAPAPGPRFKPGDRVQVADHAVVGHCRAPWYLRGKPCVVAEVQGRFRDPERLAYHRPGQPALVLYKVRFRQRDIWAGYAGPATDELESDIYEPWLRPAVPARRRATTPRG